MNRGMTMVEVLLALGLLSLLMVASLSWTRLTAKVSELFMPLRWDSAADRVMDVISEDLATGDFPATRKKEPRVEIEGKTLRIRTRSTSAPIGEIVRQFNLRDGGELVVTNVLSAAAAAGGGQASERKTETQRKLLDGVAQWTCAIEVVREDGRKEARQWLSVTVNSSSGRQRSRRVCLHLEEEGANDER